MLNFEIIECKPYSPEWYTARRDGIGGSDAAKALGLSKWGTPLSLYEEKIGVAKPKDETWEMKRGKALEPLLRQDYADSTGRNVLLPKGILRSKKYPFMLYNPDGMTEENMLIEFKTAQYGKEWGDTDSDEIPHDYLLQVQHGLIVTGFSACDVRVSIGGNRPKPYMVEADADLQEMIIEGEAELWKKIQNETPPEPITEEDVNQLYRKAFPTSITATPDILQMYDSLKNVRATIKAAEGDKEIFEVEIKNFMGENDTLIRPTGEVLCTWKNRKGAARLNAKLLRQEHPDIAAAFTEIGEEGRTFLVK